VLVVNNGQQVHVVVVEPFGTIPGTSRSKRRTNKKRILSPKYAINEGVSKRFRTEKDRETKTTTIITTTTTTTTTTTNTR
jgi:hypothetical protein